MTGGSTTTVPVVSPTISPLADFASSFFANVPDENASEMKSATSAIKKGAMVVLAVSVRLE
jgi:hypothetical protein